MFKRSDVDIMISGQAGCLEMKRISGCQFEIDDAFFWFYFVVVVRTAGNIWDICGKWECLFDEWSFVQRGPRHTCYIS